MVIFYFTSSFLSKSFVDINIESGTTINAVKSIVSAKGPASSGKSESRYSINYQLYLKVL